MVRETLPLQLRTILLWERWRNASRVLSIRSDNEHILLYHLTAGSYKYDMADHNCTGLTDGQKNPHCSQISKTGRLFMVKLRKTLHFREMCIVIIIFTLLQLLFIQLLYIIQLLFFKCKFPFLHKRKMPTSLTGQQNWTNFKITMAFPEEKC